MSTGTGYRSQNLTGIRIRIEPSPKPSSSSNSSNNGHKSPLPTSSPLSTKINGISKDDSMDVDQQEPQETKKSQETVPMEEDDLETLLRKQTDLIPRKIVFHKVSRHALVFCCICSF
jgi:hypothetical protein